MLKELEIINVHTAQKLIYLIPPCTLIKEISIVISKIIPATISQTSLDSI